MQNLLLNPSCNLLNNSLIFFSRKMSKIRTDLKSTTNQTNSPHHPPPSEPPSNFPCFTLVTVEEAFKCWQSFPNKQCSDQILTFLLKLYVLVPTITIIITLSFQQAFSILIYLNLDREDLNNYHPISNPSVLSKLTKKNNK